MDARQLAGSPVSLSYLADSAERTFEWIDSMISVANTAKSGAQNTDGASIVSEDKKLLGQFLDSLEKFSSYASRIEDSGNAVNVDSKANFDAPISYNHQPETFLTVDTRKLLPGILASINDARVLVHADQAPAKLLEAAQIPCRALLESLRLGAH